MQTESIAEPGVLSSGRVLLVEDDDAVRRGSARILERAGFQVTQASDAAAALEALTGARFEAVLSDIRMPGQDGVSLLAALRKRAPSLPVILITGSPSLETAISAVEHGAFRYLLKPIDPGELVRCVRQAVGYFRLENLRDAALGLASAGGALPELEALEPAFERALSGLWVAFQPIVEAMRQGIHGFEALVRSREDALPHPGALIAAADRLGRLNDLGRAVRAKASAAMLQAGRPERLFVNLHPSDLLDDDLFRPDAPLRGIPGGVVLELTERAPLDQIPDLGARAERLTELGYALAIDDLGAGYSSLGAFARLQPQVAKFDMSLVRGIDERPVQRDIVRSMSEVCRSIQATVVAEGVETANEARALREAGCTCLQGFLFARPGPPFPQVDWAGAEGSP